MVFLYGTLFLEHIKYILSVPHVLKSFCWEIFCNPWWQGEGSLIHDGSVFSCCFQNSPFFFGVWQAHYNVYWDHLLWLLLLGSFDLHVSACPYLSQDFRNFQPLLLWCFLKVCVYSSSWILKMCINLIFDSIL